MSGAPEHPILIVGAGISGLACAWFLRAAGREVRVLEASDAVGGCIRTRSEAGFLYEEGPNSTLDKGEALRDLVSALGIEDQVVEAAPDAKKRFVVRDGRPMPLPMSPLAFLRTPLFSARGKLRLLAEPFRGRAAREETVAEFVRRRLGQEFLDWAIDPFISGVYAGDPARLSARAATAKVYALEAEHGSLIVGALARVLRGRRSGPAPAGRLIAFREGMQALPRALAGALGEAVCAGRPVSALARGPDGGWRVSTPAGEVRARELVLATPAHVSARLLEPLDAELARSLDGIRYPPVASVALGFERAQIAHPLDGFGMLIPRRLGIETLGTLFSSTLFPGRAGDGEVLLTSFIGGAQNTGVAERAASELAGRVLADIAPLLGVSGAPRFTRVCLWPRAIPQYELGHLERLAAVDARVGALPGLHLRANWRDGISVGDCVNAARALAEALARR